MSVLMSVVADPIATVIGLNATTSVTGSLTEPIYVDDPIDTLFSETIDPATVICNDDGSGSYELYNNTGDVWVACTVSTLDNLTFTLTPDASMTKDSSYTVYLDGTILNTANDRSYNGLDFTFTAVDLYENWTTYTEVDTLGRIAVTNKNLLTITNLDRDETAYIYKDFGAGYFSGDYVFESQMKLTGGQDNGALLTGMLANAIGDGVDLLAADDFTALYMKNELGTELNLILWENNGGVLTQTPFVTAFALNTDYYWKMTRDETVGTYGTLYVSVYSDASRTVLVETKSVTLTEKQDFRYLYSANSFDNATSGRNISAELSNFEIVSLG